MTVLVSFSGSDGAGKSTQIARLEKDLEERGYRSVICWSRGGYTPGFSLLKRLLRSFARSKLPSAGSTPQREKLISNLFVRRCWLVVAIIDLLFLYAVRVRWWRLTRRAIILDRYIWDTAIDFRLNFARDRVEEWLLWRFLAWVSPQPDFAFLLLLPVEDTLKRCAEKDEPFSDTPERSQERLDCYEIYGQKPFFRVIDARVSVDEVTAQIREAMRVTLRERAS